MLVQHAFECPRIGRCGQEGEILECGLKETGFRTDRQIRTEVTGLS